jgi:hypothetical protein
MDLTCVYRKVMEYENDEAKEDGKQRVLSRNESNGGWRKSNRNVSRAV